MTSAESWSEVFEILKRVLRSASQEECERKNAAKKGRGEKGSLKCNAEGSPLMAEKLATLLVLYEPTLRGKGLLYDGGAVPLNEGSLGALLATERIVDGGDFVPGYALGLGKKEVKENVGKRSAAEWQQPEPASAPYER